MAHSSNSTDLSQSALNATDQMSAGRALETLRASQKLIHLGRLAASIAHEVNNPLESIANLLYLLRSEPGLSKNALHYLDLAEHEMKRVVTITRQTLNFARETNLPVDLSLPAILEEVLLLYHRRIDEKQIRIIQRYSYTEPIRLYPGEMRQVLANLVANAIEACPPRGSITLRVRAVAAPHRAPGIRITVADNGPGIPPELRRRLGEPFFTTKGESGTGLGLWVSQSIVARYGGHLRLRSVHISEALGQTRHGSVFVIFLPFKNTQSNPGTPSNSGPVLVPRLSNSPRGGRAPRMRRSANDA